MVSDLPGIAPREIRGGIRSQWRYAAALPVGVEHPVSLGEGCTPLLKWWVAGLKLGCKLEWINPTSSFKDRGTSVMLSVLRGQGVDTILEDSSGNGGSSVAAYAAAAGMRAKILAPKHTSQQKLIQARMHGAEVELVPGSREATASEALRQADDIFYASHNWHPFFLQGTKLLAYEIWEDLRFNAPDNIVMPVGAGSLVLGCYIGFSELIRAGQIERLPRLLAAQPVNCSPLAAAFRAGARNVSSGKWTRTLAEGTSISRPVRAPETLDAIRATGGTVQTVTEAEIVNATGQLAAAGLYVEPTAAVAAAAVPHFIAQGALDPAEETVLILSGSGLKAADAMRGLAP